jgi:hypothetical protein
MPKIVHSISRAELRLERQALERRPQHANVTEDIHLMAADERNTEPVLQDMAARTELHSIDTLTLSDAQFLRADKAQLEADIAALRAAGLPEN